MRSASTLIWLAVALTVSCGKRDNPDNCRSDSECPGGRCNLNTWKCEGVPDAGQDLAEDLSSDSQDAQIDAGDDAEPDAGCQSSNECVAPTPVCMIEAARCVECTDGVVHCVANPNRPFCRENICVGCQLAGANACLGATPACDSATGRCVECNTSSECGAAKPICDTTAHRCGVCTADSDCVARGGGSGVCMPDGHCATEDEAVYVEYTSAGCPDADGTSAKPYCTFAAAAPVLSATRDLIILRGPANDQLSLGVDFAVTVLGRQNGGGEQPTIAVAAGTGVAVTSGQVLVRNMIVTGGTGAASRSVAVAGTGTKLTLTDVKIAGSHGVGVEAKTGAELLMNRCMVQSNATGGVFNNGAKTSITNTVLMSNGYGIKYSASALQSSFTFNTVVGNTGNAATCDDTNPQSLASSIVLGLVDTCTGSNLVTTAPAFDATGYHLTAHVACPTAPTVFPSDDIDGLPRTAPIDCGADQFLP